MSSSPSPSPAANRVLARLPPPDCDRLLAAAARVRFGLRDPVYRQDGPLDHVYFPLAGVFSAVTVMADGAAVEVGTVGREGVLGAAAVLGADRSPVQVFCQVPGDALRLPADRFRAAATAGPLADAVRRHLRVEFAFAAQTAACNRLHTVEDRCARWLLTTRDRVDADDFPVTQEFLATMLGVRRASVTVAAGALQDRGLIRYSRGRVVVLDRAGLEAAACECYHTLRGETERLLG
jgi:CRP-like cAMP-binding protein